MGFALPQPPAQTATPFPTFRQLPAYALEARRRKHPEFGYDVVMLERPHPTPYPDVNVVLQALLAGVQTILGTQFIGLYLYGSLTSGDFDRYSDVDFLVATADKLSEELFLGLQALHDQIATMDVWCATQLEGAYIPKRALRRYDPAEARHPHIDRGAGERLDLMDHDQDWIIQRYVLRERGLTVAGPAPKTLIDPVLPADLRGATQAILQNWLAPMIDEPSVFQDQGYQSYTVLTLCRMLYTLEQGQVISKPAAACWARETLNDRWAPLIERAWVGRQTPHRPASANDVNGTQALIQYVLERSRKFDPGDDATAPGAER